MNEVIPSPSHPIK